jgi:hypothetical protein
MDLHLTPSELLTTTRTVRKRLDLERPVDRGIVEACLQLAFQAPNGSNQQMWNWVLVDDPTTRGALADIYRAAMDDHIRMSQEQRAAGTATAYAIQDRQAQIAESVMYLRDHLHEVPVLVVPTIDGRMEACGVFDQASRWVRCSPRCGASCWRCARKVWEARGRHSRSIARLRSPNCSGSRTWK